MRQLVGTRIQLRISEFARLEYQRNRFWRLFHLRFEQLMDAGVLRVIHGRRIPLLKQLTLGSRQHIQTAQQRLGIVLQRFDQTLQRRLHVSTYPLRIDPRRGLNGQCKALAQIVHGKRQRIVGPLIPAQDLDFAPRAVCLIRYFRLGAVPIIQQRAEQRQRRGNGAAALRQRQRRMFVTKQRSQAGMRGLHPLTYALLTHVQAHRQGIDEHPQRAVGTVATLHPPQQHRTEHNLFPARRASQNVRPRQMMQAGSTHTQTPGLPTDPARQLCGHCLPGLPYVPTVTLHIVQTEWQRRLRHLTEHFLEERFVGRLAYSQSRLRNMVTIRYRRRQSRCLPQQIRLYLMLHHFQRHVVQHHVVKQQNRHPATICVVVGVSHLHQGGFCQIQPAMPGIEALLKLLFDVSVSRLQFQCFHGQWRFTPDYLDRLVQPLPQHRRSQDVMPGNHALKCPHESLQVVFAWQRKTRIQQIGVTL
ncbi:hypothetical protein APX70_08574 [Pseudomonas syringae pv. maculicola]|uniref:Uncharacterized protein n=1 Tax=Pseudomonas syringae pv. maculicola TaxID=59511 RepID=A0A3M2XXK1_PSEYM|nr:hypothetical protein APX70_08574 [Pseudomonas syringae pv. maculicola]